MRLRVGADVDRPVVERHVICEGIVAVLMVAAGVILVDEDLQAIVVPVLHEWIAVTVEQDVVDDLRQDVKPVRSPHDLETALKIRRLVLRPQPAKLDVSPLRLLPRRVIGYSIDNGCCGCPGCRVVRSTLRMRGSGENGRRNCREQ